MDDVIEIILKIWFMKGLKNVWNVVEFCENVIIGIIYDFYVFKYYILFKFEEIFLVELFLCCGFFLMVYFSFFIFISV